jgi:ribosomal protein L23
MPLSSSPLTTEFAVWKKRQQIHDVRRGGQGQQTQIKQVMKKLYNIHVAKVNSLVRPYRKKAHVQRAPG